MLSRKHHAYRKVTVVGIGLIGGSLAKAVKQYGMTGHVVGVSRRQVTLNFALKNKVIDRGTSDLKKAVENADLVILALPVKSIIHVLSIIARHLKRGCIVTDVGSIKGSIMEAANRHLPPFVSFVGAHPMAGSEKSGIAFADANLFKGSTCILTPTDKSNRSAVDRIRHFWTTIGAQVRTMAPQEHDEAVAYISHAPHLLAYGLVQAVPSGALPLAASGFRDTTRIAASDPKIWADIALENSKNIVKAIDESVGALAEYRRAIISRDEKKLMEFFTKAKEKRDGLEPKTE